MSYNEDVRDLRKRNPRRTRENGQTEQGARRLHSIAFHPTLAEKAAIKEAGADLDRAIPYLLSYVESGNKLTIGQAAGTGATYATLTQGGVEWQNAVTLSAFHADPVWAICALAWVLADRYTGFPDVQLTFLDDNW